MVAPRAASPACSRALTSAWVTPFQVEAASDHLTVAHEQRADGGIRRGAAGALAGQIQCFG
jgi:hypothetical protein